MHSYGNWPDELFAQIDDAAEYIGLNLRKWGRINVTQYKEKFGTARVYCSLGWSCFHVMLFPGQVWIFPWWPYRIDRFISGFVMPILNFIAVPIQKLVYRHFYKKALNKWPHLADEIVSMADFGELLEGLVLKRYKHSDYWKSV